MLQDRPRYMVGWMPLVYGGSPGKPSSRRGSCPARSSAVYSALTGIALAVSNAGLRSPRRCAGASLSSSHSSSAAAKSGVCSAGAAARWRSLITIRAYDRDAIVPERSKACATLGGMALAVTAELITRAAASLSAGGWRYTPKQLYYATCAEAETPATPAAANGAMALGVLCVLLALILIGIRVAFAALLSLGIALIAYGLITRLTRRPVAGRVLAISFAGFERLRDGLELTGLVEADA